MKTIVSPNNHTTCESTSETSFWPRPSWLVELFGTAARKKTLNQLNAAYKVALTGLSAFSHTLAVNKRLYMAIVLMLVVAPLVNVSYHLFDSSLRSTWYHVNNYYLFHILAPWMGLSVFTIGTFLLFPNGSKRAYFLVIPLAHSITKILWLVQVTSNEELLQVVPLYFFFPAAAIAFVCLVVFDWLMARKYHSLDNLSQRMDGLFDAPIPDADKLNYLRTTWTDLKNFDKKY